MAPDLRRDRIGEELIARFTATLGSWLFVQSKCVPLGIHWCLFPTLVSTPELKTDGHGHRAHAISEDTFPRRMWIGGAIDFVSPFPANTTIARTSKLMDVRFTEGRTGPLALAGATHIYHAGKTVLARERQDLVYRGTATQIKPEPPDDHVAQPYDLVFELPLTELLLFRYSAVTFNSHRIHYDRDYARDVEGYTNLVVHGPLQATVLLNIVARLLGHPPAQFKYCAVSPLLLHDGAMIMAQKRGNDILASIKTFDGRVTMVASAAAISAGGF
jgi:3-methylfumaryl-CoA hydratase